MFPIGAKNEGILYGAVSKHHAFIVGGVKLLFLTQKLNIYENKTYSCDDVRRYNFIEAQNNLTAFSIVKKTEKFPPKVSSKEYWVGTKVKGVKTDLLRKL